MKPSTLQTTRPNDIAEHAAPSPQQQAFDQLVETIAQQRRLLQDWQHMSLQYEQTYLGEYQPLLVRFCQQQTQLLRQFNLAYDDKRLNGADRRTLSELICQIAASLPDTIADDDVALIVAMHRTPDPTPATTEQIPAAPTSGIEPAAELADWERAALEREAQKQQRQATRKAAKKTKADARLSMELHDSTQSLRAVYRKLASQLHPDREPDPQAQERKTALMQRVNLAYGNKDLLQLLELQLETEQIDATHMQALPQDQLRHYNRVLTEQLSDINQAIREIESSFGLPPVLPGRAPHAPHNVLRELTRHCRQLQKDIETLTQQLRHFSTAEQIVPWLKSQR